MCVAHPRSPIAGKGEVGSGLIDETTLITPRANLSPAGEFVGRELFIHGFRKQTV